MRTGFLLDVAAVLKSLLMLGQTKSLSFSGKKMLERRPLSAGQRAGHFQEC